jgi:hypothetical protein
MEIDNISSLSLASTASTVVIQVSYAKYV